VGNEASGEKKAAEGKENDEKLSRSSPSEIHLFPLAEASWSA
jgi:hypothetical protein